MLIPGSRNAFALYLIPFIIALADRLAPLYPEARFIWPVSSLLKQETLRAGIAGQERDVLGGSAGQLRENMITTASGAVIEMIPEKDRYRHMHAADLAVTIPGTNTLELGIAGVPSVVILPLNKPEIIPLEGLGHWLSLIPVVGTFLKRSAVKLFVEGLQYPVALPNQISGEALMLEIKGMLTVNQVADAACSLLNHPAERIRRHERLREVMPRPGAATRLVDSILADVG
jgi:lipid-A-disaccharide synthase